MFKMEEWIDWGGQQCVNLSAGDWKEQGEVSGRKNRILTVIGEISEGYWLRNRI